MRYSSGDAGGALRPRWLLHARPARLTLLTSAQSPLFARGLARLIRELDEQLATLIRSTSSTWEPVAAAAGRPGAAAPGRARLQPIEVGDAIPDGIVGLLMATEWLDNVPLDLARDGRYLYDGEPVSASDAAWIRRWWPSPARQSR